VCAVGCGVEASCLAGEGLFDTLQFLGIEQNTISGNEGDLMTSEEREQMNKLCRQIAVEKDYGKFLQLIVELNDLLDTKAQRLEHKQPSEPHTKI
jgi:hypothetical protein